ncbi:DNA replication/repair protein RecF [Cellulophaga baltica]|uniref:DNA replication/repair protein RecF n=1 Tax=Cellulophaga TaxID=104264 RepID=UPI001C071718|nr:MULTISPECIES: DNA replication/repair protein RecF [Cellulophaga]MBU2996504.1 DNA replication/repair protein RecF [Cellulophaga baltica]MDO6767898.1 DNA replication/repair protein RecF [Cellulophaga sp. 1_MG-2023]
MFLKKLSLINYKNFSSENFEFDNKINCFVGQNGIGKTNVLDAIYHLSFGKSYFNPIATQNIKHGEDFFVIEGNFEKNDREEKIVCSLKKGAKKIIKKNSKAYDKLSDHIGFLPLVIISPSDRDLITEGSDTRRKFIDGVISQSDKGYLQTLLKYNKILSQRNSLLKYFTANQTFDKTTLSVYNEQLDGYGTEIFNKRVAFLETFIPIFKEQYKVISGDSENISLVYDSKLLNDSLLNLFDKNIDKDRALQYTSVGIHKDDLNFNLGEYPIKKFGSQGQQKSFLIALKLAQFHFIKAQANTNPILLLDDIFDKLDENRVSHIISLVNDENFGQLFISDTHADRTEAVIKTIHQSYKMFKLGS